MHGKIVLLVLFTCIVCIKGDLSLSSTALVHEKQYYEATLDNAAQAVLRKLSKDKEIAKGSRISKVDLEDTRVAESILYSIGVQMDIGNMRGVTYEMQFVQPLSPWHPLQLASALPYSISPKRPSMALALHGSVPTYVPPEISITLRGPLELYFPHATTELSIKTPRYVDVGFVDRLILTEGTNISLSGSVELRLRDSLSIDSLVSVQNDKLVVNTKEIPKINVYGQHIDITNATSHERLKVQKKFSSVVEISSLDRAVVNTGHFTFDIPLNDSRLETIKHGLERSSESAGTPFPPKIYRLVSGSRMEAVVGFLIALEVEDLEAGTSTLYDVVVAQGSNHKEAQIISVEKKKIPNEVAFSQELMVNRTLPSVFEDFQKYLQTNGRML